MTIIEAVVEALKAASGPLTAQEVLDEIQRRELYAFRSKQALSIVRTQMQRHSRGYDRPSASSTKYLEHLKDDRFRLI